MNQSEEMSVKPCPPELEGHVRILPAFLCYFCQPLQHQGGDHLFLGSDMLEAKSDNEGIG